MHSQPRAPTVSWAGSEAAWPAGPFLLSPETLPGVLHSDLQSLAQEGHKHAGVGDGDSQRAGVPL